MTLAQYDVVVVGAGCAGLTAAIGLSRAGFTVAVLEASSLPGANDIGGVFFAENLATPDILGPQGVEALAWERRLVERSQFLTDGRRLFGCTYRDPDAFRHCFTVLTPIFNDHLAQIALAQGVALLTETTVIRLIREGRRIIGVATSRGPLYSDLVFLAEGDAGHLVSREGYDRSSDPRAAPAFLYSLQQIIDLPPGAIEECFRVGPEQGVAHDLLLRNPRGTALNVRGFVCTNRQSVTLSIVLSADNLRRHFHGDPRQLLAWFADMPALQPWWREGRRGAWTARLLRSDGLRDVPYLAEEGLAIGGAAAGLGAAFPVLNSTGPATCTAMLLSRAAIRIRSEDRGFDREQLSRHYVEPLRQTRYWRDMEFLQRWPGYVRRTHVLFDQELDLLLDSASVWTRRRRWLPRKLLNWFRLLGRVRWTQWSELADDLVAAGRALHVRDVMPRPAVARILLDGVLNAFRDLVRRPRPHLPPAGTLRVHYYSADDEGTASVAPALVRRWFARFEPVLASAGRIFADNNDMPLSAKMTAIVELLVRQVNLLDLLLIAVLGFVTALASMLLDACSWILRWLVRPRVRAAPADTAAFATTGEAALPSASPGPSSAGPLIHIVWRSTDPQARADAVWTLPRVCPADVFEIQGQAPTGVHVRLHAEKCIECEACWRTHTVVDWANLGPRRLRTAVLSPLVTRLLEAQDRAGPIRPTAPRCVDTVPEERCLADLPRDAEAHKHLARLVEKLEHKLREFEEALSDGPAALDRPGSDHLELLARYAQEIAIRIHESIQTISGPVDQLQRQRVLDLVVALRVGAEERARRTWDGRFSWAVADGSLLRQHHLAQLRCLLGIDTLAASMSARDPSRALRRDWVPEVGATRVEDACLKHLLADIAARRYLLETLELAPRVEQGATQAELIASLASEVRDGLTMRMAELHDFLQGSDEAPAGHPNPPMERYARHGPALLGDAVQLRSLLAVLGDWETLAQRRALLAEREEIRSAEERLTALAGEWQGGAHGQTAHAEVSAGFARQAAHVLAGKLLLLRTFERLEEGLHVELAIALLRVWLDFTATLLDEFTIRVHECLPPSLFRGDRPLVEFGSGPPPRTLGEYLAAPSPYSSGDFLLAPLDLLQPRLVPEMLRDAEEIASLASAGWCFSRKKTDISDPPQESMNTIAEELVHAARGRGDACFFLPWREEILFLIEALALETLGRRSHPHTRSLDLELACARLLIADLHQRGGGLRDRCIILRKLADEIIPRWLRGGVETRVRHLGREVLELEALKEDLRRRMAAAWQTFGTALGHNADVQASCFALAEAVAWLKAADSTLARMAWFTRMSEAEERDEPADRQVLGRRVLTHCYAEVRDRLFRFEEDLASLRRGYYAPHVRAATLLLMPRPPRTPPPPQSRIERPLRVLVVVEPLPAIVHQPTAGDARVMESYWTLDEADRSALENALRLRDVAEDRVHIEVAAIGPPRVAQALREILSLNIESVRLFVPDRENGTVERAARALAAALESTRPFDLILGAVHETRLTAQVAETLGLPVIGHALEVEVQADADGTCIRLHNAGAHPPRERPLPAAVLIEAGTPLRPFTIAGYVDGLTRAVQTVTT